MHISKKRLVAFLANARRQLAPGFVSLCSQTRFKLKSAVKADFFTLETQLSYGCINFKRFIAFLANARRQLAPGFKKPVEDIFFRQVLERLFSFAFFFLPLVFLLFRQIF